MTGVANGLAVTVLALTALLAVLTAVHAPNDVGEKTAAVFIVAAVALAVAVVTA